MTNVHGWQNERDAVAQAARRAGQVLIDYAGRVSVRMKGKNDPVTEADHASQAVVRKFLEQRFPADGFIGEEDPNSSRSDRKRHWLVDPLDGTANYVHGFPFYCVTIALESEGQLVVAATLDPIRNELFLAAAGQGATCNGVPLHVSAVPSLGDALVCVGLPADLERHGIAADSMNRLTRKCQSMRRMGSAALALAYVAAGRLDGYWAHKVNCWDVAAGALLVQEAGGRVNNGSDGPYDPFHPRILATNGLFHEELEQVVLGENRD